MTNILDIKMTSRDVDIEDLTIGQYLTELLCKMWEEGESFNGKRPWGNSGWQFDVYKTLIREGVIAGTLDDEGCIDELHYDQIKRADLLITEAVVEKLAW